MNVRFHVGQGRYESLTSTRYKDHTYSETSIISENLDDNKLEEGHGSYGPLLFDKRWKQKRQEILARDNYSCVICQSTGALQVHHRQYHFIKGIQKFKSPWDYENHLMISLCERCHGRGHSKYRVPTIYI